ncbi:hypothetical protein B0H10DRAFT_2051159 [Mycena sp. CBHHK59/15]|nr:hypothetical protein B0H10DRAFT_2051159 [Mycena sp. CBHHK59/15]
MIYPIRTPDDNTIARFSSYGVTIVSLHTMRLLLDTDEQMSSKFKKNLYNTLMAHPRGHQLAGIVYECSMHEAFINRSFEGTQYTMSAKPNLSLNPVNCRFQRDTGQDEYIATISHVASVHFSSSQDLSSNLASDSYYYPRAENHIGIDSFSLDLAAKVIRVFQATVTPFEHDFRHAGLDFIVNLIGYMAGATEGATMLGDGLSGAAKIRAQLSG